MDLAALQRQLKAEPLEIYVHQVTTFGDQGSGPHDLRTGHFMCSMARMTCTWGTSPLH